MAEAAAKIRRRALKPEQPVERFGPCLDILWQEGTEFLGQIKQDRAALENAHACVLVEKGGDLGVRVHINETARELITLTNVDKPCIIFGVMPGCQKLFQHHSYFYAVRCRQRMQLQRMLAHWQVLVVGRACDGTVDIREASAAFGLPDFRGGVAAVLGHLILRC